MKKIALAALVAVTLSASALEVGINGVESTVGNNRYGAGVTVGQKMGDIGVTAGVSRFTRESNDQTRWSLVADKQVFAAGPIGVAGRVGVAYLDNRTGNDGLAATVGVGASMPITKQLSVGVSVDRQFGQHRVNQFNGNIVTAGVKVGF
jgi:outer membrane autotransporter protein